MLNELQAQLIYFKYFIFHPVGKKRGNYPSNLWLNHSVDKYQQNFLFCLTYHDFSPSTADIEDAQCLTLCVICIQIQKIDKRFSCRCDIFQLSKWFPDWAGRDKFGCCVTGWLGWSFCISSIFSPDTLHGTAQKFIGVPHPSLNWALHMLKGYALVLLFCTGWILEFQ